MITPRFVKRVTQTVLLLLLGTMLLARDAGAASFCSEVFWPSCWDQCYDNECGTDEPPNGCGICCENGTSCGGYSGCYDNNDEGNCGFAYSWCVSETQNNCACSACCDPLTGRGC